MKPGTFDPPELSDHLLGGLSGGTAFDVGAGVGNVAAELVARFDLVIGFEPSMISIDYWKTIPRIAGIRIYDLAISDHDGYVFLDLEEVRCKEPCRSLDSLSQELGEPDFIKVDVQGHEVQVLEGAQFLMIAAPPEWLIEVYSKENSKKCRNILNSYGYDMRIIKDPHDSDPVNHYWIRARIRN